ncbi:MAG: LPXTG cell wall anchor domain-containing protein, partial [Patescibacteria group bacterium]
YDISPRNYVHVTYMVRVKATTANGTYGASNQVTANGGVNLSNNGAVVIVTGSNNPVPPTPTETRKMTLSAVAYNATVGGNTPYKSTIVAKRGETVKFKIALTNSGTLELANVKIAQSLPAYLTFVPGTAKVTVNGQVTSTADSVMTAGINVGSARVGAGSYLEFDAVVKKDTPENTASLSYSATATADATASVSSLVTVTVDGKTDVLPDTGTSGNILALIVLALFLSTASYVYLKESGKLEQVVKLIKR